MNSGTFSSYKRWDWKVRRSLGPLVLQVTLCARAAATSLIGLTLVLFGVVVDVVVAGNPLSQDILNMYQEPDGTRKLLLYMLDNLAGKHKANIGMFTCLFVFLGGFGFSNMLMTDFDATKTILNEKMS